MSANCEYEHVARAICLTIRFEFIRFVDSGAYKETYQIKSDGQFFALKVFKPNNSNERSLREIDAMRRICCDNVAKLKVVDTISINSVIFLYFIEEFLAGGSLGTLIKLRSLSVTEIVSLGNDLINALQSTYNEHIVHRDIKPDNIMFRGKCVNAVLVDFGLVRDLDATSLTQGFLMRGPGTPMYSSPEQLNNEKAMIDWRTDQFALAVTLCISMIGVHPFESTTPLKTIERIAQKEHCNRDTIEKLEELGLTPIIKMLEPYPIKRFRTPEQLKAAWQCVEVVK